jgi:hypothetical protein
MLNLYSLLRIINFREQILSTDHELIPAGCKRSYFSVGVGTKHAGGRKTSYWSAIRDVLIHSLTANIRQFGSIVTALFMSFFERRMFSCSIVKKITSARRTLHCRKTRIPCGDQLVICRQHQQLLCFIILHNYIILGAK